MQRRHIVGAVAALALATRAQAQSHDHHAQHKGPAQTPAAKYTALQTAAADCVAKGQVCLSHCLVLLGDGNKDMAACAQAVNQMLALCGALQNLSGQGAKLTPALSRLALDACDQCAEACKPHVEHHAECKACRDACLECARQCKAVI